MVKQNTKVPAVSIIIVSYNNFTFLENCLKSLYNFTREIDFEVIIIDNNSTERGIDDIVREYDNIFLIKNIENKGFAKANNQGLSLAKGDYILFLNNDTLLIENSVYEVFNFAKSLDTDIIVGCKLIYPNGRLQHSVYDFPTVWNVFTSNFFLYLLNKRKKVFSKYHLMNCGIGSITEVDVVTGAFLFVNKSAIIKINGFDERFYFYNEETDLCYRFRRTGGHIYYYPNTKVIHIQGGTTNKNPFFKFKNQSLAQIRYFQKHFRGFNYFLLITFHFLGMLIRIPILLFAWVLTRKKYHLLRAYHFCRLLFLYPKNEFK